MPAESPSAPLNEKFVSAEVAADFLSCTRRFVVSEARAGRLPAHPLGRGRRKQWRFKLSELDAAVRRKDPNAGK